MGSEVHPDAAPAVAAHTMVCLAGLAPLHIASLGSQDFV